MALHQFDSEDSLADSRRAQRMTADEAQSVIALWQQEWVEQTGLTDRPAVPDVAEGLDIAVEDVQRLLAEVRARRLEEERKLAQEQKLAKTERRLAKEEARLADIQQQRVEARQKKAACRGLAASRRQGGEVEPVPWEVWKAAQPRARWIETKPGIWEDGEVASPPCLSSKRTGLESRRVGRTIIKVCVGIMLFYLILVALASTGIFRSHEPEPCYINGEPAPANACSGFDQNSGR